MSVHVVLGHLRWTRTLLAGAVAALVVVSGTAFYRWWHNRPPFGPDNLRATATLQLLDTAQTQKVYSWAQRLYG